MCQTLISSLGGESVRKVRRTNSVNSADVIKAAGESSQTDPTAFIEQQRQLLNEMNAKTSGKRDNDGDVDMQDKDKASQIDFKDDHFTPNSDLRDDGPITKQPGLSNVDLRSQDTARKGSYHSFVNIEKEDYEKSVQKYGVCRPGMSCRHPLLVCFTFGSLKLTMKLDLLY